MVISRLENLIQMKGQSSQSPLMQETMMVMAMTTVLKTLRIVVINLLQLRFNVRWLRYPKTLTLWKRKDLYHQSSQQRITSFSQEVNKKKLHGAERTNSVAVFPSLTNARIWQVSIRIVHLSGKIYLRCSQLVRRLNSTRLKMQTYQSELVADEMQMKWQKWWIKEAQKLRVLQIYKKASQSPTLFKRPLKGNNFSKNFLEKSPCLKSQCTRSLSLNKSVIKSWEFHKIVNPSSLSKLQKWLSTKMKNLRLLSSLLHLST